MIQTPSEIKRELVKSIRNRNIEDFLDSCYDLFAYDYDEDTVEHLIDKSIFITAENRNQILKFFLTIIVHPEFGLEDKVVRMVFNAIKPYMTNEEKSAVEKSLRADGIITEDEDDDYDDVDKLIEQYYQDLIDALFQKKYDEAWSYLNFIHDDTYEQIGSILWRLSVQAPQEQFREFLTLYKVEVLYDLLSSIKYHNFVNAREIFKVLQREKLDWPELMVIEKSLRADGIINENETDIIKSDPQARRDILNYFFKAFEDYGWKAFLNKIRSFSSIKFDKFPELQQPFIQNRDDIIRDCLRLMHEGYFKNVSELVADLKYLGFDWEELDIIQRSLNAEKISHINETKNKDISPTKMIDLNAMSEEEQIEAVQKNGEAIQFIQNPSEAVQLAAVQQRWYAILHIENPTEAVQLAAVKHNPNTIEYIKNPSEAVQLAAVTKNGFVIKHISKPSEAVQLAAVQQDGWALGYMKAKSKNKQVILTAFLKQLKDHRLEREFLFDTYFKYKRLYPDWEEWDLIDRALKDIQ